MLSLTTHFNIDFYWNDYLCILLPWNLLLALFNVLASCLYLQYHSQLSLPYNFSFLKFSCSSDSTVFKTPFTQGSFVCSLSAAVYAWQWILRTDLFIFFGTLKSPSVVTFLLAIRQHGAAIHSKLSEVHEGEFRCPKLQGIRRAKVSQLLECCLGTLHSRVKSRTVVVHLDGKVHLGGLNSN